jgi:hypothetical protein
MTFLAHAGAEATTAITWFALFGVGIRGDSKRDGGPNSL